MFPFNQSYRPRPSSPDPPISPSSLKGAKKSRKKVHYSPYTRPTLPTPSSPSEGEYDLGSHQRAYSPPKFQAVNGTPVRELSSSEYVMRIIRESPFEEGERGPGGAEREGFLSSPLFSLSPEPREGTGSVPPAEVKEETKFQVVVEHVKENVEEQVEEQVEEPAEEDVQEDAQPEESMEEVPSSEADEIQQEPEVVEDTAVEDARHEEEIVIEPPEENEESEETPPPRPLAYGDLVMVDYAEKRKSYKWPAILVPPAHMIENMLDFPPEDDPTAVGVRWIEPQPSYSWVPEASLQALTPEMIDEFNKTIKAPKKLVAAWQMARNPPNVFDYMLEKKKSYHRLIEAYTSV